MRKALLVLALIFLAACAPAQPVQNATVAPACNPPSYEYTPGDCCLDKNANKVCDRAEQQITGGAIVEVPAARDVMSDTMIKFRKNVSSYSFTQGKTEYAVQGNNAHVTLGEVKDLSFMVNETLRAYATDYFVERKARKITAYCDPRTETRIMGTSNTDRSVCRKLINIPMELPFDQYNPELPEDWLTRLSHSAPTLVEDTDQFIKDKTINPVLHFSENSKEIILRLDARYGLPVKVEIGGQTIDYSLLVYNRVRPEELMYHPYSP